MIKLVSKKIILLIFGDALIFYAALWGVLFLRYAGRPEGILFENHVIPFGIVFLLWLLAFGASGLYELRLMKNERIFLVRLLSVMAANIVIAIVLFYLFPFAIEPRRNLFGIAGISAAGVFAWRLLFNLLIVRAGSAAVLFLGVNREVAELADFLLHNPQIGQKPVGFVANGIAIPDSAPLIPAFSLLEKHFAHVVRDTGAETIVLSREMKENKTVVRALFSAIPLGIAVIEFPAFHEMITGKVPLSLIEEAWFLENLIGARKRAYDFFKRVFDLFLACVIGGTLAVLFPFIALGIFLSTPGDIWHILSRRAREGDGIFFFRQKRMGKNGRVFDFIKFRSQRLGAERMHQRGTKELVRDPRQYPFGRFLRAFYLDELPQVWNVLRGEMSFIGPRPERPEYIKDLGEKIPFYEMRLLVLPGITGWAQVNMEDDASVEDAPEKMQYDLYYIKHRSAILDLLIMLRTFFTIVQRKGR